MVMDEVYSEDDCGGLYSSGLWNIYPQGRCGRNAGRHWCGVAGFNGKSFTHAWRKCMDR